MAITKASGQAVAPAAKGDLVVGSATNDAAVLGVGTDGQVLTADSTQSTGLKWATGALTWTRRLTVNGITFSSLAYNGSNLYVLVGQSGNLYTSPDGITWTSRTSGFGANDIYKVHYASGLSLWIAVGGNGTLTTSSDGVTWTARTANVSTNALYDVFSSGTTAVAVGAGGGTTNTGGITYSTDGITWTRKSQSITIGATYTGIIYNGTNWCICAGSTTNNLAYASTPSGTWTPLAASTNNLIHIFYDGTQTIWVAQGGTIYFSTNANLSGYAVLSPSIVASATSTITEGTQRVFYASNKLHTIQPITSSAPYIIQEITTTNTSGVSNDAKPAIFAPGSGGSTAGYIIWSGTAGKIVQVGNTLYTSF